VVRAGAWAVISLGGAAARYNSGRAKLRKRVAKVTWKRKNRKYALHRTTDHAKLQESSNLTLPQTSQFPSPVGRRADLELRRFHAERRAELAGVARLALAGRHRRSSFF